MAGLVSNAFVVEKARARQAVAERAGAEAATARAREVQRLNLLLVRNEMCLHNS